MRGRVIFLYFRIAVRSITALSLRPFSFAQHAAPELFSGGMELLPFASRPLHPCRSIMDLAARFIRSHFALYILLVSEPGGRQKPPAHRAPCIFHTRYAKDCATPISKACMSCQRITALPRWLHDKCDRYKLGGMQYTKYRQ